jgi:hypothetical protein
MSAADTTSWRYVAEYTDLDGRPLATMALEPDFGPACEWCQLAGVGAGVLSSTATLPPGTVTPVWADEAGAPRVKALRVSMDALRGDRPVSIDVDASLYLRTAARRGASRLVESGAMPEGQLYRHGVLAFAQPLQRSVRPARDGEPAVLADLAIEEEELPVAIVERPWPAGAEAEEGALCPVVVHEQVERDLVELARGAGENECGAGLLGHLARDPRSGRMFVEVTALAPVRGGLSDKRSFVFTDESWASVHEIATLRGLGELFCGYAHSHPMFCRQCPPERQDRCALARPFFSEEDVHLQRTCFPKAWQVALLASDLPRRGMVVHLFGWNRGVVAERPYVRIPAVQTGPAVDRAVHEGAPA